MLVMDKPVPKEKKVILAVKLRHKFQKDSVSSQYKRKIPQIPHSLAEFNPTSYKFLTIIRTDF